VDRSAPLACKARTPILSGKTSPTRRGAGSGCTCVCVSCAESAKVQSNQRYALASMDRALQPVRHEPDPWTSRQMGSTDGYRNPRRTEEPS
jgi:hypothetical protein